MQIQSALQIIAVICQRVPPVLLLQGFFDRNWEVMQPYWILHDLFKPINNRISQLYLNARPYSRFGPITPLVSFFQFNSLSSISQSFDFFLQSENDPDFQASCVQLFKNLILSHSPVDSFKPLFKFHSASRTLMRAILEILHDLNTSRTATQEQLIFSFSFIVLYMQAFSNTRSIDGQPIAEYIQTQPFISPFLLLAIVNHIFPLSYLYTTLLPKEIAQSSASLDSLTPSQYCTADLSIDSKFSSIIPKISQIFNQFFLSSKKDIPSPQNKDEEDFVFYLHTSKDSAITKIKLCLTSACNHQFGPLYVSQMNFYFLIHIMDSIARTLPECVEKGMLTPSFSLFFKSITSLLSPIASDQLAKKFFNAATASANFADLIMRWTVFNAMHVILFHPSNEKIATFCIKFCKLEKTSLSSHFLITKLLRNSKPKLTAPCVSAIEESKDNLILLEYCQAILYDQSYFSDANSLEAKEYFNKFIRALQMHTLVKDGMIEFDKFASQPSDQIGKLVFQIQESGQPFSELQKVVSSQGDLEKLELIHFLSFSSLMVNLGFASASVNTILQVLAKDEKTIDSRSKLQIKSCDIALPISQFLIMRFLIIGHIQLAEQLLLGVKGILAEDSCPLHWISLLVVRFRPLLTQTMRTALMTVIQSLPMAKEYKVFGIPSTNEIASLLVTLELSSVQDPYVITREFTSPVLYAQAMIVCWYLLSDMKVDEIAQSLAKPLYDIDEYWPHRDLSCITLSTLAASNDKETSIAFFELLMRKDSSEMSLLSGRHFLLASSYEVFREICRRTSSLIEKNPKKLEYFVRMIMPSFRRLEGGVDAAKDLLCGLLDSLSESNDLSLQYFAFDAVTLAYSQLKLYPLRESLISASNQMCIELRNIFPHALDVPQA